MNRKPHILLVEDEVALGSLIRDNLEKEGYQVTHCEQGEEALRQFFALNPDLVILDVMMPKRNGYDVARTIRNTDRQTPILFLTAKIKSADVVKGFQAGGNDYLRKPFGMDELLVRLQALLSRDGLAHPPENSEQTHFALGRYTFDYPHLRLSDAQGKVQKLTAREAELLKLLCAHQNQLLTKASILLSIWGDDSFFHSRSMDVFISRLRKYLRDEPSVNLVNLRGVGYKLVVS